MSVKECVCVCVYECVCVLNANAGAVAVWCSQAAPDVPQQSTVQKLFISPSKAQQNYSVWGNRTDTHTCMYMHICIYLSRT